ncbi:chloride channel protein EriC [Actinobacteria bacterium IMCC26256]|nr:chloride channel protein EriC [Actinobacteria bacterium IMCC26256]
MSESPVPERLPSSDLRIVPLLLAAGVGVITGLVVTGIQQLTLTQMLARVQGLPVLAMAAAPAVGLVLAALCLRFIGRGTAPVIADAYIRNIHEPDSQLDLQPVPGRLMGAVATIGFGGALGLEAVALYAGAGIGAFAETRLGRFIKRPDTKMLMVAGAAAGVATLFQTPLTGAIFALEVPFRGRLGRHNPAPILVASLAGYLVNVAIEGPSRLFPVQGNVNIDWRDLLLALALGIAAGAVAHVFAILIRLAKRIVKKYPLSLRLPIAGLLLFGIVLLASTIAKDGVILGTGTLAIKWAADPTHALGAVAGMLILRIAANAVTLSGGGVGGVFIPLVAAGALTGRLAGGLIGRADDTLFAVVGAAAFLGAGYRVPLAAVTFVAETTGRPGFIIPAMIAAFAAELTMGSKSVSEEQRDDAEATW